MDDYESMNVDDLSNISVNRVEQDDTVVYLGKGAKPKLGVVSKVYRGNMDDSGDKGKEDGVVIDVFPGSVGSVVRSEDEIYVADRGFSLSESVVRISNPKQVGFVRKIHVKADVIVLPERKIVAQNVDLSTAKFIEPFASGGQNFLLFDDWIGTALKSVFELTVVFRNCYRCKIKDNVDSGILYRRKDYGVGRQWVPGETVMISTSYVLSNKAEWETEMPSCLVKRKTRGYSHHTPFVIEKVSLYAVKVRWLTTPSASIEPPPERITKPDVERIIKLDTLEYTQALCGDRMKMKPDDRVTVMRKNDWEKVLAEELIEKLPEQAFKGRRRRMKKFLSSSSSSSSCSTRTSTNSVPLKKRPSTSFLSSTHDQGIEGDRYNDVDDENSSKLGAESPKASSNSASGYDNNINGDSGNNVATNNNDEECDMVCDNDEVTANDTSRSLNDNCNDTQPAAAVNPHQSQLLLKMEVGAEVEVSSTSPKSPAVDHLSPLRFVKKNKPTTFNIRQIRRNKQNRAMKRKAARSRIQLDMRSCLGEEFYGDIMRTYSTVDVVWMDGTIENNVRGIDLVPYELDLDHHDDVPGTIVARKINAEKEGEYGIVISADTEKRLATVQWYLYDWKRPNSEPVATERELCSLFDLMLHPTYQGLWWGSLCLRTSKESSDVRSLIGQLITTNENGKNTVAWFNGITEEVWPIEITILVTNEEMDMHFDEDGTDSEDDETWNSIDSNDDESDIDVINDPTLASSGLSLSITITETAANDHDLFSMNGRILIPQDVLKVKISGDEAIHSKILEDDLQSPSEGWLKTIKGQALNLSEILAILKETKIEFEKKNSIDSREVMARINFIVVCLKNSTLALHYTMNEFFFTYIEERIERLKLDNDDESRAKASLKYMIGSFEEMTADENCKLVLDEDHKSPSLTINQKQFSFSAGMLFFEKLFNDWIVELRSLFDSVSDPSITLDCNKQPSFFRAFDFLQCSPFKLTWDDDNTGEQADASETSKNKKETVAEDTLKTDISKGDSEKSKVKDNEDDKNNRDNASQNKKLSFECHMLVDSFDFVDNIMPQLEASWTDLDINMIKETLNQFIGEFLSTEAEEHSIDDKTDDQSRNSVGKEDAVKKYAVDYEDDNKTESVIPNFNELSKKEDKMMYSIASALSTYLLTLLHNILCSSNENPFFASYGHVESNFRRILHCYYSAKTDELLEKEKGKSRICWDNVMERIVEKWYMESMNFTNLLKAALKKYFKQITNRIKLVSTEASGTDSLPSAVTNSGDNNTETADVEMEGDENERKPSDHIKVNKEETEVDDDATNDRVPLSSSLTINKDRSRRFPALDFINEAPSTHAFHSKSLCADRQFARCVHKELDLLSKHLPDGIFVRAFEDRLDLLSLVIIGPRSTPFEDVPLFFDVHLPATYPAEPPLVHYWAFSQEQLNPNLYQTGKICISLLGTWNGKGSEQWTSESNLLQVFLSIQGLILVAEPYFNEAGYESRKNAPVAVERSRRYNEMALVNSLDYFYRIMRLPPKGFEQLIKEHCQAVLPSIKKRIWSWQSGEAEPEFPLCPISEGCKLSLRKMAVILGTVNEGSSKEVDENGDVGTTETVSSCPS